MRIKFNCAFTLISQQAHARAHLTAPRTYRLLPHGVYFEGCTSQHFAIAVARKTGGGYYVTVTPVMQQCHDHPSLVKSGGVSVLNWTPSAAAAAATPRSMKTNAAHELTRTLGLTQNHCTTARNYIILCVYVLKTSTFQPCSKAWRTISQYRVM